MHSFDPRYQWTPLASRLVVADPTEKNSGAFDRKSFEVLALELTPLILSGGDSVEAVVQESDTSGGTFVDVSGSLLVNDGTNTVSLVTIWANPRLRFLNLKSERRAGSGFSPRDYRDAMPDLFSDAVV